MAVVNSSLEQLLDSRVPVDEQPQDRDARVARIYVPEHGAAFIASSPSTSRRVLSLTTFRAASERLMNVPPGTIAPGSQLLSQNRHSPPLLGEHAAPHSDDESEGSVTSEALNVGGSRLSRDALTLAQRITSFYANLPDRVVTV